MKLATKILIGGAIVIGIVIIILPKFIGGSSGDKLQYYGSIIGTIASVLIAVIIFRSETEFAKKMKLKEQKQLYLSSLKNINGFLNDIYEDYHRRLQYSDVDKHISILNECSLMYTDLIADELIRVKKECTDIEKNDELFNYMFQHIIFRARQINQFVINKDDDRTKESMAFILHNVKMIIYGCQYDDKLNIVWFKNGKFISCDGESPFHVFNESLIKEINKLSA